MANKRVQSDPNLPLVPLRSSVQAQGGTFSTVVPDVPKSNSALRIATAINQIPGLTGQLSNINEKKGIKAAEQLTAQELDDIMSGKVPAPDGGLTGGLGFRKGFGVTHAKRWWETVGIKEYSDLENELDAEVDDLIREGYDITHARSVIQGRINEKRAQIDEYFADKPLAKGISNLIHPQVTDKLEIGLLKGYQKKAEAVQVGYQLEKINEDGGKFASGAKGNISLKAHMKEVSAKFNSLPLTNSQKKDGLRSHLASLAQIKLNERNWEATADILNQAQGMPMFNDLQSELKISDIAKAVQAGKDQDAKASIPSLKAQYTGAYGILSRKIKGILAASEEEDIDVENELLLPMKNLTNALYSTSSEKVKEDEAVFLLNAIKANVERKDPNSLNNLEENVRLRVQEKGLTTLSNRVLNAASPDISRYNAEMNRMSISEQLGTITDAARQDLEGKIIPSDNGEYSENAREFFKVNPRANARNYMDYKRLAGFVPPQSVLNAQQIQQSVNILKDTPSYKAIGATTTAVLKSIETEVTDFDDVYEEAIKVPGGMPDVPSFIKSSYPQIMLQINDKVDSGLLETEEEILKEATRLIDLKKEEYKIDLEARKNYQSRIDNIKNGDIEKRGGSAEYVYKYTQDKNAYIKDLLRDKYFWGTGSATIKKWEKFEALSEDNLDVAFGLKKKRLTLTSTVLQANIDDARKDPVEAEGQGGNSFDAFKTMLLTYGYPTWDIKNVASDLENIGEDWTEVSLFESEVQIEKVAKQFQLVLEKFDRNPLKEGFTAEERKLAETAVAFGLYPDSDPLKVRNVLQAFEEIQKRLYKKQYKFK